MIRATRYSVCRWLLVVVVVPVCWLARPAAAEVRAVVEPRIMDELDTARLTIRATGSSQVQRLNLRALEDDFEVLTTQSSSQYRAVNGKVESWVEYQVMLRPRHSGELAIPSIRVNGEDTEPLTLRVRGIDPELRAAIERMVFFETELTTNPVYVQAQTVMIRRLYYASGAQIYSDLPGLPEVSDAIVMPLGETTSSSTIRDGQRYGMIEQRFAIFPERSGALEIPAISVTSSVRLESAGRTRRSGVRIATQPMTLEVMPIPRAYPAGEPWLPAENLSLDDRWSPVDARVKVGDPVNRTLSARVEGNVSSAIPPLDPALPAEHFRRYPEPPNLNDNATDSTVTGVRAQTYAIIPTAPGAVNVPPSEVVWWDVNERRVRTARSPGRTLRISGAPVRAAEDPAQPAPQAAPPDPASDPPPRDFDVRRDQVPWPGPERRRALWLTTLGVLAGAALLAWLLGRRPSKTGSVSRQPASRRAWRRHLNQACREGDPHAMHQALLGYLRVHYRAPLAEAVRRFREEGNARVLDGLNAGLYRSGGGTAIGPQDVLAAVRRLERRPRANAEPLPALYD